MLERLSASIRNSWQKWNIRGLILFSLFLQTILVFVAPSRKFTRTKPVIFLIWSAYLLADWAANFSIGQISTTQKLDDAAPSPDHSPAKAAALDSHLMAFWAPFVLLHSGGPDTITAFALEDNALWRRHLFQMVSQLVSALYVFLQSLPDSTVYIPTALVFLAGFIKYSERIWALYISSLDKFRDSMLKEPDPGPNYAKLMEEYASKIDSNLPTRIIYISETDKEFKSSAFTERRSQGQRLAESEVVQYAFFFFNIFKGLLVDRIFSFRERDESRAFFIGGDQNGAGLEAEDALRVIEVELNFIYEVFYTKVRVVQSKVGYIFRFLAVAAIVAALVHFHFIVHKEHFDRLNKGVTYALLLGAVALEAVALCMLFFSDWTFALLKKLGSDSGLTKTSLAVKLKRFLAAIIIVFMSFKKSRWHTCKQKVSVNGMESDVEWRVMVMPILFGRWSGSVPTYNLIGLCSGSSPKRMLPLKSWFGILLGKIFAVFGMIFACLHLKQVFRFVALIIGASFAKPLGSLTGRITACIRSKMELCLGPPMSSTRLGERIVQKIGLEEFFNELLFVSREPFTKELWEFIFKELKEKSQDADDSETARRIYSARGDWVLTDTKFSGDHTQPLMHYVTDVPYDESVLLWHIATEICYHTETRNVKTAEEYKYRELSKLLSDYMLFLLVIQESKMMSAVAGIGKIRFRDTCAEAKIFFRRRQVGASQVEEACREIISVNTDVEPSAVKGDESKSVLFEASRLAKVLKVLEESWADNSVAEGNCKSIWELISSIWVELLAYAASHCRASTHAQQVTQGGELITFVWLLMAHFGIGEQFQINVGRKRAKLIVKK